MFAIFGTYRNRNLYAMLGLIEQLLTLLWHTQQMVRSIKVDHSSLQINSLFFKHLIELKNSLFNGKECLFKLPGHNELHFICIFTHLLHSLDLQD